MAIVVAGSIIGCRQKEQPQTPAATSDSTVKPFTVKANDGIDHEFHRDVSLDALLKQLPSGSVDSFDLSLGTGPQVFALVKVPDQPKMDLAKVRFTTRFTTQDGQAIEKQWRPAKGRKPGEVIGLFSLPPSVIGGETQIAHDGD
jgi:hypothetical protein